MQTRPRRDSVAARRNYLRSAAVAGARALRLHGRVPGVDRGRGRAQGLLGQQRALGRHALMGAPSVTV